VSRPYRPQVVAFDVVETLASLDPVARRLTAHGMQPQDLSAWFTRLLRDAMALTAAGGYAPFAEVAASALTAQSAGALSEDQVQDVVAGFGELVPQPDAVAAIGAARDADIRVVALTNGSAANTRAFLERAGVAGEVERVVSIDEVRAWKPHPEVYRHALEVIGVGAELTALVAVHSWDIVGARRAGMTTGWCPRLERVPTPLFGAADVVADTLDAVVMSLAALPEKAP
jgi:2-haloacid dehalogenase